MEFEGKLILIGKEASGVSRAGKDWRKKEWVFETFGAYPHNVAVSAMNDRINNFAHLTIGQSYKVSVDADSREYNGRWYTELRMYAVSDLAAAPAQPGAPQYGQPAAPQYGQPAAPQAPTFGADAFTPQAPASPAAPQAPADDSDDLPF